MKYNKIIAILSFISIATLCYSSDIVTGMKESELLKQGKHLESKASLGNRVIYKFNDCIVKVDNGIVIKVDFRNLAKEQLNNKYHEEAAIKQKQLDEQRVKQNLVDNANNVIANPAPEVNSKPINPFVHTIIKHSQARGDTKDESLKNVIKNLPPGAEVDGSPIFEEIPANPKWIWGCTVFYKVNE